jgi:hypothetical protein
VLIECSQPDAALELAAALSAAGCTVGICRGPSTDAATRCPLHGLEPCVAVEGADLVVNELDLADPVAQEVVRGLRTRYPSTSLILIADSAVPDELDGLARECTIVSPAEPERIVEAALNVLR